MKQVQLILILLTAGVLAQTDPSSDRSNQVVDYETWKTQQGMFFPTIEESYRILIFNDKAKIVQMHNADPSRTYDMAVNKFSAYSDSEFEDIFLQTRPEVSTSQEIETPQVQGRNLQGEAAPAIDWVTKGMITKIKNQGNCGSCWAFETTAALQAMHKIDGSDLLFSEQELVDCVYNRSGCEGGWFTDSLQYTETTKISLDSAYPYIYNFYGYCRRNTTLGPFYSIQTYTEVANQGNCLNSQNYLQGRPFAVAVYASKWISYSSGIFNCSFNATAPNHGALLVGFDAYGNWKLKNSWGTNWGEKGYIRLLPGNSCGVCDYIFYPTL